MNPDFNVVEMIIPTVMIPLTLIGVGISVVATFVASLFGVQLKAEGPKKLLELLIKPRVLALALLFNAVGWGLYHGWLYWKNYPRLIVTIHRANSKNLVTSEKTYENNSVDVNTVQRRQKGLFPTPVAFDQLWNIETGGGVFNTPVISSNSVFSGNRDGFVYEVDLLSGKLIRKFYVGSPVTAKISIWKNMLFVGEGVHDLHHARVYKFDLKSSQLLGTYQSKGHIEAQSVISEYGDKSIMFVPSGADGIHAVDPQTMQGLWHVNHGHIDSAVMVQGETAFFATGREKHDDKKNKCYAGALNFKDGSLKWKHELPGSSWLTPTAWKDEVCYVVGEVYFKTERGHVVCFDQKTGEHKTAINVDEPVVALPLVMGDTLYFSTVNGTLYSYDMNLKKVNWVQRGKDDGDAYAGPSYDSVHDLIIYPTFSEGVKWFSPDTGNLAGHWKPSVEQGEWIKNFAGVAIKDDLLVFADYKRMTRALKASEFVKVPKKLVENSSL